MVGAMTQADAERRRSPRIKWRIPFVATWASGKTLTVREQGETEVINAHGALIRLATHLRRGSQITLLRPGTNLSKPARVVGDVGPAGDGRVRLGVELEIPSHNFWVEMAR